MNERGYKCLSVDTLNILVNVVIFFIFFLPLVKLVLLLLASINVIEAVKNLAERK